MDKNLFEIRPAEILQFLSLIITALTAIILVKTYKRNRKIDLENHLFKLRTESYSEIVYQIEKLFSKMRSMILVIEKVIKGELVMTPEDFQTISSEVDAVVFDIDAFITKHSIYFSEETLETLLDFSHKLYGETPDDLTLDQTLEKLNFYYDSQMILANKANISMRSDLGIEELNKSLFKRYDVKPNG